jgi:hypothetical protein
MPFCWMDETTESTPVEGHTSRGETTENEVRDRASLLRRLGYSQADAVHRCLGNVAWAFSVQGKPAITPARIRKVVLSVYSPSS